MRWLLDFFYCRHGASSLSPQCLGAMAFIVFWALLVFVFVLFG
jgi:hypothetical protein